MTNYEKRQNGYTLIELMVSIAIIGTLSTVFVINYRIHEKSSSLDIAAQQLASDIRRVQSYALSLKEFGGAVPDGGWGIYLNCTNPNNKGYNFFVDLNGNHKRDNGEDVDEFVFPKGLSMLKNPDGIYIDDTARNPISISFYPPDPEVWICRQGPACTSGNEAEIVITNGEDDKSIIVNKFGLVDVVN